jgi:hypothetical protein
MWPITRTEKLSYFQGKISPGLLMRKTIQPKALQAPEIRSADFGNKVSNGLKVKVVSGHNNEFSDC